MNTSFKNPIYDPKISKQNNDNNRYMALENIKTDVDDVVNIMKNNVEKATLLTPKLNDIDVKAEDLASSASKFKIVSKKLKCKMLTKKVKMILLLIVIILIIVLIIGLAVGVHK